MQELLDEAQHDLLNYVDREGCGQLIYCPLKVTLSLKRAYFSWCLEFITIFLFFCWVQRTLSLTGIFFASWTQTAELTKPDVLKASRFPSLFLRSPELLMSFYWIFANAFQIWSTLDGYEKLAEELGAISSGLKHVPAIFLGICTCLR